MKQCGGTVVLRGTYGPRTSCPRGTRGPRTSCPRGTSSPRTTCPGGHPVLGPRVRGDNLRGGTACPVTTVERLQLNVGETLATCPCKAESSSHSSTRLLGGREQTYFWECLLWVSVEKHWEGVFYSSAYRGTRAFACTGPISTVPAPSILPDCTACFQWSSTSIHAATSEIFRFSPFNTITPTVFADRTLDRLIDPPHC